MTDQRDRKGGLLFSYGDAAKGGAIYSIRSFKDIAQVTADTVRLQMVRDGITITPEIENAIQVRAEADAKEMEADFRSRGVPKYFTDLFAIEKKSVAVSAIKQIKIEHAEFAELIHNADQVGFKHTRTHVEYVPNHLRTTDAEREAFLSNGVGKFKTNAAKKFVGKIAAIFKERKSINAHLFENADGTWHLFWFTFKDLAATQTGNPLHWKGGDHVHYTSYLWGHKKEEVWKLLQSGSYSIANEHIPYNGHQNDGK